MYKLNQLNRTQKRNVVLMVVAFLLSLLVSWLLRREYYTWKF